MTRIGFRTIAGLEVEEHVLGEARDALPLVVALHGRGGSPALPFGSSSVACRVLVPRGPFVLGEGFAWSSHYARESSHEQLATDLADVADRLRTVVSAVTNERGAAGRAIAIGFSQGAMTALALATRHPHVFADAIVGAAWLPPALEPFTATSTSPRIRMAHGEADEVVPFEWAEALALRLRMRGWDADLRSFAGVAHSASADMEALLTAWREAALARACGLPEPPIPTTGTRLRERERTLWERLRLRVRRRLGRA